MKIKLSVLFFFNFFSILLFSQKHDYVWVFDDSTGIDFNFNPPVPITTNMYNFLDENSASISDKYGNLQFYLRGIDSNTVYSEFYSEIYSYNNQLMMNGDSIPTGRSLTQGGLILPSFSDSNQYYFFYINNEPSITGLAYGFYYALIDMSYNGGTGEVLSKNNVILNFLPTEKLTAIRHGNGRDWWILMHEFGSDTFYKFLFTPNGISQILTQNIGTVYLNGNGNQGQMIFSKNGTWLSCAGTGYNSNGILDLFNFDRCTGIISNWVNLSAVHNNFYGCSISPNESKLYASTVIYSSFSGDSLFQFDLNSSNIPASKFFLFKSHYYYTIGSQKLAPDNKIYLTTIYDVIPNNVYSYYNKNLTVIDQPDSLGAACNLMPYSFHLGGHRTKGSLPNMVNYRLGADEGSPCDTILSIKQIINNQNDFTISPNPAQNFVAIKYGLNENQTVQFVLFNSLGQKVKTNNLLSNIKTQSINVSDLSDGIYFYQLKSREKNLEKGKLIILR